MEESTSKEKVLKSVREALISKTDQPFPKIDFDKPIFREMEESEDINFAQELTAAGGNFIYCESESEFLGGLKFLIGDRRWGQVFALEPRIADILKKGQVAFSYFPEDLTRAHVGVTGCECLVARLGSVMVSTGQMAGRKIFVYPEIHIVLANASQLVGDLKDAFQMMRKKYENRMPSMMTLITGPSRTSDIEKTPVTGVHGPHELYVFLVEDRH
jgi:L-lactate dehydrogenase complex protein LldG